MWIVFAVGSAVFAGLMSVLSKIGIKNTDSDLVTAVRTFFVFVFSWIFVFFTGAQKELSSLSAESAAFLVLSGLSTGISWLCYFRALKAGEVNKVAAVDKTSTVMTVILAIFIFNETDSLTAKIIGIVLITSGTLLMSDIKSAAVKSKSWFIPAVMSAFFAAVTSILAKVGLNNTDSNLGTAIRTSVVLILAWIIVFSKGAAKAAGTAQSTVLHREKENFIKKIPRKDMLFIFLSGLSTAAGWLCYYKALSLGEASLVVPIDKMSILITTAFSVFVLKEKLKPAATAGLVLITAGTLVMTAA